MSARRTLDRAMTERELMEAVIECAQRFGWKCMHIPDRLYKLAAKEQRWDAMTGAEDWPDLILVRNGVMWVVECKTERGQVSDGQHAWLQAFATLRFPRVAIWRPSDWSSGEIEETLR